MLHLRKYKNSSPHLKILTDCKNFILKNRLDTGLIPDKYSYAQTELIKIRLLCRSLLKFFSFQDMLLQIFQFSNSLNSNIIYELLFQTYKKLTDKKTKLTKIFVQHREFFNAILDDSISPDINFEKFLQTHPIISLFSNFLNTVFNIYLEDEASRLEYYKIITGKASYHGITQAKPVESKLLILFFANNKLFKYGLFRYQHVIKLLGERYDLFRQRIALFNFLQTDANFYFFIYLLRYNWSVQLDKNLKNDAKAFAYQCNNIKVRIKETLSDRDQIKIYDLAEKEVDLRERMRLFMLYLDSHPHLCLFFYSTLKELCLLTSYFDTKIQFSTLHSYQRLFQHHTRQNREVGNHRHSNRRLSI